MSNKVSSSPFVGYLPIAVAGGSIIATVLIAAFGPAWLLPLFVALLVCLLLGVTLRILLRRSSDEDQPDIVRVLLALAPDEEIATVHGEMANALLETSSRRDPIFRSLALDRLQHIADEFKSIGNGRIEFKSTESWRLVYEQLLRSPGLHLYRSVAHVETPHYWQDGPGQQSTQLNLELQDASVLSIERTVIVADHLWPDDSLFPIDPIHDWIDEQHRHGIWLLLVRESTLESEPDLICDFGIYGNRAIGMQSADPTGRTIRFVLDFKFEKVQEAEGIWNRLGIYAASYRDLLDQQH